MNNKKNTENFNWELVAKHLANETTGEEKRLIKSQMQESQSFEHSFIHNKNLFRKIELYYRSKRFNQDIAWNNVQSKMRQVKPEKKSLNTRKHRVLYQTFVKYAAIILLVLTIGSVGYYYGFHKNEPFGNEKLLSSNKQNLRELVLPDGSKVTLNSNSTLSFPDKFAKNSREVQIQGEAFFEVTPNPDKPFIISAGKAQIKVLGTSFNVRAYPSKETVEVIVKTGKVQVTENDGDLSDTKSVYLDPGEKGTLNNNSLVLEKNLNNDVNYLAWKTFDIVFTEMPLSEVIACLNNVYHVDIETSNPEIENLMLTASFNDKSIDFVLDVIRMTFDLEVSRENETYLLKSQS